jgi:hypothetical protein
MVNRFGFGRLAERSIEFQADILIHRYGRHDAANPSHCLHNPVSLQKLHHLEREVID